MMNLLSILAILCLLSYIDVSRCIDSECVNCDLVWRSNCYKHFSQQKNWVDANSSCVAWGGRLVSLSSQQTINVVSAIQDSGSAWNSYRNKTDCSYLTVHSEQNIFLQFGKCSMLLNYTCSKNTIDEPPTDLTLVSDDATSVTLSWLPPTLAEPNDTITHYIISFSGSERDTAVRDITIPTPSAATNMTNTNMTNSTNNMSSTNMTNVTNSSMSSLMTSYTLTELEEYTTYIVRVTSFSQMSGRTGDVLSKIRTLQDVPNGVLLSIHARALSATTLFITWLPPNASLINGILTSFTLQYSSTKKNGPWNEERVIPVTEGMNNFFYILDELTYGGPNYTIRIAANTGVGSGPFSATLTAETHHSALVAPRDLTYTMITPTTIQLSWESPQEENINGIPQQYIITYRGFPLDDVLHTQNEIYNDWDYQAETVLMNLQENTTYTISVYLIVSGIYSPVANLTISTRDTLPSEPVQDLIVKETSQYSAGVFWRPPPLREQNARILYYSITTAYTHPSTSIPQLIDNFTWTNRTYDEYLLLRYLWYSVNFTVTVTPFTQHGMGPNASTTFLLRKETLPEIYNPERDQFITIENASDFRSFYFECAAEGNPTPVINWSRRDGSRIEDYKPYSYNVSFTTNDLKSNQTNVYVCNASNRVGSVLRTVTISVITENIGLSVLQDILAQIELQSVLDSEQAVNIIALAESTLNSETNIPPNSNCTSNLTQNSNCSSTYDEIRETNSLRTVADITLQVAINLEENTLDLEDSQSLFRGNSQVVRSSLEIQNGTTQNEVRKVTCKESTVFHRTEISVSNSVLALEILIPKIVSGVMQNNSNLTLGEYNSTVYSETVLITPENVAGIDNITLPTASPSSSNQRVLVPSDLLLSLPNYTNTTNSSTLISTTIVGENSSSGYNDILSLTFSQKSNNLSKSITQLSKNITIYFPSQPSPPTGYELICVFFNSTTRGWSDVGVHLVHYDDRTNTTICTTNHLSTFAVLIRTRKPEKNTIEKLILSIISYVLMSISFLSLFVALILFAVARKVFFNIEKNGEITLLYFNQTLALFFATGVLIFGIEATNKLNDHMCVVVAVLLHYLWIAVLAWNMCLAIYSIYRFFIDIMDTKRRIWGYLMVLGWGFPLPFVIASLAVTQGETYISEERDYCWISTDGWIKWLFFGPVYFVITVNILLFHLIIFRLCQVKRNKNNKSQNKEKIKFIREILTESILMTFVLGLPWVITLAKIFTYVFNGEHISVYADKVIDWLFLLINFPAGIVLLIIVLLKYRDLSTKTVKYYPNNSQSNLENSAEAVRKTLPRAKPKPKLLNIPQGLRFSKEPDEETRNSSLAMKLKKLGNSISSKIHASMDRGYSVEEIHENDPAIADNNTRTKFHLVESQINKMEGNNYLSSVRLLSISRQSNLMTNQNSDIEVASSL